MVVIPTGSFEMGSPSSEAGRNDSEGPTHRVNVKVFAMGKTHLTKAQFSAFISATGYDAGSECFRYEGGLWEKRSGRNWRDPGFRQDDSHPVVCLNWTDAKTYTEWIAGKTGNEYRLPSEAEWEYAARAGTTTARYWGESADQQCAYANGMDATGREKCREYPGTQRIARMVLPIQGRSGASNRMPLVYTTGWAMHGNGQPTAGTKLMRMRRQMAVPGQEAIAPSASCAAVPGATGLGACARRFASGSPLLPGRASTVSG
jgi:hypothetical protein